MWLKKPISLVCISAEKKLSGHICKVYPGSLRANPTDSPLKKVNIYIIRYSNTGDTNYYRITEMDSSAKMEFLFRFLHYVLKISPLNICCFIWLVSSMFSFCKIGAVCFVFIFLKKKFID